MDIQKHPRTQQIQKLSRVLVKLHSALRYLLYFGWLIVVLAVGELMIGSTIVMFDHKIDVTSLSWLTKSVLVLSLVSGYACIIRISNAFRQLMQLFIQGDIFNVEAISLVKKALKAGIAVFCLYMVRYCTGLYIGDEGIQPFIIELSIDFLMAFILFGFMYTLLWTLEIGSDLNAESEMTI